MAKDALKIGIEVLMKNSPEIKDFLDRHGGLWSFIADLPTIYKIMQTVQKANAEQPEEAVPMQYGVQTFAEVRAFQNKHMGPGEADGIIGDRTWLKIKQLLGDKR